MNDASDIKVYRDLVDILERSEMDQLHRGAHFILDDQGFYALMWRGLPGVQTRFNSHEYDGDAFSIQGPIFNEFLCANRQIDGKNYTWFQAERAGVRNVAQFSVHAVCWMYYASKGRNVGPDGTSIYTEAHPIRIEKERISEPRAKLMDVKKYGCSINIK